MKSDLHKLELSGERGRLARRVWRLAKHISGATQWEARRETHRAATETVALPGQRDSGVALVITLLMLSVITFLAIAFLAMSQRNQAAVSASLDIASARSMSEAAQARAQTEILADMLAHNDALFYDYKVSRNYSSPRDFFSKVGPAETDPTNVNYDTFFTNRTILIGNFDADWAQNIANLWYDPRPPVFVVTNPALPASNDFRFYVDINRNGKFETNGYQLTNNDAGQNPLGGYAFLNGEPEFIGVLKNPLYPHSYTNQFIGRYAYLILPVGKELDFNYIHNYLKATYGTVGTLNNTSVPGSESDGFARDQGVGSWELNLAGVLDAVSPWAYENNNNGYPNYPTTYGPYNYVVPSSASYNNLENHGNAFDDAEAILHYRYGAPTYALPWLAQVFPTNYLDFENNYVDIFCATEPLTAPFDYNGTNYPISLSKYQTVAGTPSTVGLPWSGSYQSNLFFDVQDLFDPAKTSGNFAARMLVASQRTNTYDRYTFQRLLSCVGMGSSPEYGAWVYGDLDVNGNPTQRMVTKVNLNYDNTAQIKSPSAPFAFMPTNLVPWTPIGFFTNAAELILRSQSQGYSYSYLNPSNNTVIKTGPFFFGVTNIPIFSLANPGIRYTASVHRMVQVAANIYDATLSTNYASLKAGLPPVRHPTVFRPLFQIINPSTTNVILYIHGYAQVTNDAWSQMLKPFQDVTSVVTNVAHFDTNGNVAGIPWVVSAEKWLPQFDHYTSESSVLLERKLMFQRKIVNGKAVTNVPPAFTNQFYCMALTNSIGMDAWNAYPSNFTGASANNCYYYFSNYITVQLTNGYNRGYTSNILFSTPTMYPTPYYGPFSWGATKAGSLDPKIGSTNGFITMYKNTNLVGLSFAYYSPSLSAFYFLTNQLTESNVFLPGDLSQTAWPVYNWTLTVTNHVVFGLFDGIPGSDGVLLDFVNLGPFGYSLQLTNEIAKIGSGNVGVGGNASGGYFIPGSATSLPNSPMSQGVLNQIAAGAATNATFANNLAGFGTSETSEPVFECPAIPTFAVLRQTNWVANDPLVHYTIDDLSWSTDPDVVSPAAFDLNSTIVPPLKNSVGTLTSRYSPWNRGNPSADMLVKDPQLFSPTNWSFPTAKFPGVGWIGRVHRGTPWQTIYLKADNPSTDTDSALTWAGWAVPGITTTPNPLENYPTNDWALLDLFTTAPNDNAARGLLSVNQTNDAAWAAVFAGVIAPTNGNGGVPIGPINDVQFLMDGPGAAYPGTNGINQIRSLVDDKGVLLHPNGIFHKVGDILAAQTLTTLSPFLGTNANLASSNTDDIVERIPQQTLSLLKVGEPQFVIFSWGQSLKPKGLPYLGGGLNNNIYTNYEITGEVLTRTVCHLVHTNGFKMVVDSYNVENGNN